MKLMKEEIIFVVRGLEMKLHRPARLDDEITVRTKLEKLGKVSFDFKQTALVDNQTIAEAKIKCGSLNPNSFKPSALPEYLHKGMKKLL
jgi:acyl-CoA thioester hydrolase